jgi:hypothetical protein
MTIISELHQDVGKLQGTVNALQAEVTKLRVEVAQLTAILNQGRGAKAAFLVGYAVLTMVGGLLAYFGIKLSAPH